MEPLTTINLRPDRVLIAWTISLDGCPKTGERVDVYRPSRGSDNGAVLFSRLFPGATREHAIAAGMKYHATNG